MGWGLDLIKLPYLLTLYIRTDRLEKNGLDSDQTRRLIRVYTLCHASFNLDTFTENC